MIRELCLKPLECIAKILSPVTLQTKGHCIVTSCFIVRRAISYRTKLLPKAIATLFFIFGAEIRALLFCSKSQTDCGDGIYDCITNAPCKSCTIWIIYLRIKLFNGYNVDLDGFSMNPCRSNLAVGYPTGLKTCMHVC